jgi:Zn-dependent peptidase ImmA (M78 family)
VNATPCKLSYDAIRDYAELIGATHDIYYGEGLADIDGLIEKLGGTVVYDQRLELAIYGQGNFVISVSSIQSDHRSRFAKAHAVAHYFLHYRYPQLTGHRMFDKGQSGAAETQANVFCSTLMMPERYFRLAFEETNGDYWELSRIFETSPAAARVRAEVLKLVKV